ncbi:MAG: NADH-quinone oxidoreductase subunit M [Bdellovibrionales bacterium]|nr:NADH-quinone oxidoreductase subunit M [Bdellovibrionales bacterium]
MEISDSLSFFLTLPLFGMVLSLLIPRGVQRIYAIFASLLFLALTVYEASGILFAGSSELAARLSVEHQLLWLPQLGSRLSLKLDSVSAWFVVLNALTAVIAFSTKGAWYRKNPKLFTSLGFFLLFGLNAAFLSLDLVVFYLAYESVFIPMIFMVGVWGERQKATAVFRFFLMSFLGSILMLVSLFFLLSKQVKSGAGVSSHLSDLVALSSGLEGAEAKLVFLGFFLAFAIKVPLVPFHSWLKDVYNLAPFPATIWMSAILSKLGVYGVIRFVEPLFPQVLGFFQGGLLFLAAVSVIYAALLAYRANHPKELLAYSSISHLGFVMLGVFTLKAQGISSAILLSVGHTLVSALLFFLLSKVEEKKEGLDLLSVHGLSRRYPVLFVALFVAVLASVSLPGTLNFAGEFLVLLNAYPVSAFCTILAGFGAVLGAAYMLKFYQQMGFGTPSSGTSEQVTRGDDLGGFELVLVFVLILFVFYFGFQTSVFLKGN